MGLSMCCSMNVSNIVRMVSELVLLLLLLLHHFNLAVVAAKSFTSLQQQQHPSCRDDERSALLQFINSSTTSAQYSHCKPADLGETSDCCSWDGIECDEKTGRVIGLEMRGCNFSGLVPSSLGNLRHLRRLDISENKFNGPIPASLANLTRLSTLFISSNQLIGPIPSFLGNLSRLRTLGIASNKLDGSIPNSLSNLIHLEALGLHDNNLSGKVEFHTMFHKLQNLTFLELSGNNLELLTEVKNMNLSTFPKFKFLGLGSCNIREFPNFLRYQESLLQLALSENKVHGLVPNWILNTSTRSLLFLDISDNNLSGFDQPQGHVLSSINLQALDLSSNMLEDFSENNSIGEISPLICNLSSLWYLDLSNNKFSGKLPQCFGNFSHDLKVLNLGNNSFHGILPQTSTNTCSLMRIDVSHNQLQGKLPRSLANCLNLKFLVLSNNDFNDVFPFWLGSLPDLKLLQMRHNSFYGLIGETPERIRHFPELRILDLSYNNFSGEFPSKYIFWGCAIRRLTPHAPLYNDPNNEIIRRIVGDYYGCPLTITTKGVDVQFEKIFREFIAVDLSSNKFEGGIPDFLGDLKGLHSLNISNNILTGCIPHLLGNLTELESLDLSQNRLSGKIPQQLAQLTFLEKFDVSHNNLTGPIPQGSQFDTFGITPYEGNPGLCGDPLPDKCGKPNASQLEEKESGSVAIFEFDWKFVLAGCVSGLVVGVVLADVAITRRQELFLKIVGMIRLRIDQR